MPPATPDSLAAQLDALRGSLVFFGPELALTALLIGVLLIDLWARRRRPALTAWATLLGLLAIGPLIFGQSLGLEAFEMAGRPWPLWAGLIELDDWSQWFKSLVWMGAAGAVAITLSERARPAGEAWLLFVALALGAVLMTGAHHLLLLYLSLELASISSYVLVGLDRRDPRRAEAAVKYVVYGAVSSALTLYGISLLYGLCGTLQLGPGFALRLSEADPLAATVALGFTLSGLAFKLSAAPFHFWAPDVYQASPVGVVSALATTSKLAAVVLLLRVSESAATVASWGALLGGVALASLTLGSLSALAQRDFRRLMAYGGIAQAGYLLLGLVIGTAAGARAVLTYSLAYGLLTLLAFAAAAPLARRAGPTPDTESWDVETWQGLGRRHPAAGIALAIAMAGLVGLPPTVGFIAKLAVFLPLLEAVQQSGLASASGLLAGLLLAGGLLYTVVSLFFYLKVPARLFLEGEGEPTAPISRAHQALLLAGATLAVLLGTLGVGWLLT